MNEARRHLRSAGLAIPEAELAEVDTARILHRRDEILAGDGLAVMPLEVEIAALTESLLAQDSPHHADDLGALVINGRRVEIGDFNIALGPDRMRQRTGVFRKLRSAEQPDIVDPLDRVRPYVGR